jgi:hypothetical protein
MVRRLSQEEFVNRVHELLSDEYTVIGQYVTSQTPILMLHETCKTTYFVKPNNVISNRTRCPNCFPSFSKRKKNTEIFKIQVEKKYPGHEYTVCGEYKGNHTKLYMLHNACGNRYLVTPNKFLQGRRCPKCFGTPKKTHEQYASELIAKYGEMYTLLSEYKGTDEPIYVRRNTCGHDFWTPAKYLLKFPICTRCQDSHGELRVAAVLKSLKVDFKTQYRIKACRDKKPLPFDFAVFKDGKLACLIEYDGEQHFSKRSIMARYSGELIWRHDKIKSDFCKTNSIPLIRIPYTALNTIEPYLTAHLRTLGIIQQYVASNE